MITHLEMPPCLCVFIPKRLCDITKFINSHIGQTVVVHYRSAPGCLATDDVATRRLRLVLAIDTVAQVDRASCTTFTIEGRQDPCRGSGMTVGERRDEVQREI